jgi:hypothetical protein
MKFKTKILTAGKTATGVEVPPAVVESLGAGKKPAVNVTINGHTYRSTVATMGGKFMIGISAENRVKAAVSAGENIEVELSLDTQPRVVEVPADLAAALAKNAAAKKYFDALSYSQKLQHVLPIAQAKTPETRQRRIEKSIIMLEAGKQ